MSALVHWPCADCGGQFWPDDGGWRYKRPKPVAGAIAVCPECVPAPWYRRNWPAREANCDG